MNTNTKLLTCAAFLLLLASSALLLRGWLIHELSRASTMPQPFAVTAYYTPELSAFHAELGFDMRPQAVPGIGLELPADFLKAVRMEGTGRLERPVDGMRYLAYDGNWHLRPIPLGSRNNPLTPMRSAAVSSRNARLPFASHVLLSSPSLNPRYRTRLWRIDDVGGGVASHQLDLYIGPCSPAGPGNSMHMPSSSSIGRITDVQVHVLPEDSILISMAPLLPWLFSILSVDKHLPTATLPQH